MLRKPNGAPYRKSMTQRAISEVVAREREDREAEQQRREDHAAIELNLNQRDRDAQRWLQAIDEKGDGD